jgi:phage-related protein
MKLLKAYEDAIKKVKSKADIIFSDAKVSFLDFYNTIQKYMPKISFDGIGTDLKIILDNIVIIFKDRLEVLRIIVMDIIKLFKPLGENLINTTIPEIINFVKRASGSFRELSKTATSVFLDIWKSNVLPFLNNLIQKGLPIVNDFTKRFSDAFVLSITTITPIFKNLYENGLAPIFDRITMLFNGLIDIVYKLYFEYIEPITNGISTAFKGMAETFTLIFNEVISPVITQIAEMFDWLWENHLKQLVENISSFVAELVILTLAIYNKFILPIINYLVKLLSPAFKVVFDFISGVLGTLLAVVSDVISGIILFFKGLIQFITGVFTGDWKKALTGIVNMFGGIMEGIGAIFKGIINGIIDILQFLVNSIITAINDIGKGLQSLIDNANKGLSALNIPEIQLKIGKIPNVKIPKLATGGIIDHSTIAEVGEAGTEAVIPLSSGKLGKYFEPILNGMGMKDNSYDTTYKAMKDALDGVDFGGGDNIVMLDGQEIARYTRQYTSRDLIRTGGI